MSIKLICILWNKIVLQDKYDDAIYTCSIHILLSILVVKIMHQRPCKVKSTQYCGKEGLQHVCHVMCWCVTASNCSFLWYEWSGWFSGLLLMTVNMHNWKFLNFWWLRWIANKVQEPICVLYLAIICRWKADKVPDFKLIKPSTKNNISLFTWDTRFTRYHKKSDFSL